MNRMWIWVGLAVLASSCGDDARTEVACGAGDPVAIDGITYCVFEQAVVVENGFECPPSAPFLTQGVGFGVCGQQAMLPPALIEDVRIAWQTERGVCVVESECTAGKTCIAGVCQTPVTNNATNNTNNGVTCFNDSDCGAGETCINGVCEPAMSGTDCGGFQGLACQANAWCDYGGASGICGAADQLGTCTPRPEVCTDIFDPVCGCDGTTYSNLCDANAAGVDISGTGACN